LNILRITLEEVKGPLTLTEEILELVNWGAYGGMEEKVRTKLNELYKIVSGLNSTVEELLGKASKITENLSTEQKMPDWKEDTINPALGNIPG
jgi:ABC-type transporter Mla subunit MlaD